MVLVSASVDNAYTLFGFRVASLTDGRNVDSVEV